VASELARVPLCSRRYRPPATGLSDPTRGWPRWCSTVEHRQNLGSDEITKDCARLVWGSGGVCHRSKIAVLLQSSKWMVWRLCGTASDRGAQQEPTHCLKWARLGKKGVVITFCATLALSSPTPANQPHPPTLTRHMRGGASASQKKNVRRVARRSRARARRASAPTSTVVQSSTWWENSMKSRRVARSANRTEMPFERGRAQVETVTIATAVGGLV
jgi:hypothetical protein